MGTVQRIRVSATAVDVTPGVVEGLLTELRPHLEDRTVVKCALKALLTLVMERGHYRLVFDAGGLDLVARALDIHGADSRMALDALEVIGNVAVNLSNAALLTSADSLSDIVRVVVGAMHTQRTDLTVFWSCCDVLFLLCDKCRAGKINLSSDVAEKAVEVLRHALSNRLNDLGPDMLKVLRTLQAMTGNAIVAGCANAAGCIELIITALHHADIKTNDLFHAYGCRALSQLCVGYELERIDACGFVEVAFESLRMFPDCRHTQGSGVSMLLIYRLCLNGCALDADLLGPDAVQAALHAMRLSCKKINSVGIEGNLGASLVAEVRMALDLLGSLNDSRSSSWLFPLLDEPETTELLKRSLRWLERAGETDETLAVFVQRMTQGACCGCGELQDTKMKMCARCGKAAYCGPLCQRRHWPEHKRECKQQPNGAAAGARQAE